jgi:enoyl-CoA hydratase/carnithine racemase
MGIAQPASDHGLRVVTERTKMAMPEVNIGLFPDVGGSYFLARAPGQIGNYLGLTGLTIGAADALYVGLADVFIPGEEMPGLLRLADSIEGKALPLAIRNAAAHHKGAEGTSSLATNRATIDRHFGAGSVGAIMASLEDDADPFAQKALAAMKLRSPLMMCVTHELLLRGARMGVADCLRMERNLVRRNFEHGEVLEGVRALVIDKDNAPRWNPPTLEGVTADMVARFFEPCWPESAHPLRFLA